MNKLGNHKAAADEHDPAGSHSSVRLKSTSFEVQCATSHKPGKPYHLH